MQTLYTCLFIAALLPYACAFASVPYRIRQFGKPDLRQPRVQAAALENAGARAVGAQKNAWEALAVFTVTVFLAYANNVGGGGVETAAMVFVAARVLHPVFYIADMAPLRTLSFFTGFGACLYIMGAAVF